MVLAEIVLPVDSLADAQRCQRWYSYRWLIEPYHYVLKTGCGLEKVQLETALSTRTGLSNIHHSGLKIIVADL
ncbi:MAG: hypothetical protein Fur0025_35940 [Oscillatoriaceae cyanobacterium]